MSRRCLDCHRKPWARDYCSYHYKTRRKRGLLKRVRAPIGTPGLSSSGRYIAQFVDGKRDLLHRIVMSKLLGRPLLTSEHVHHVNENRYDNRPENLELLSSEEHTRRHKTRTFRNATHKQCRTCHAVKPRSAFYPDYHRQQGWDPHDTQCKRCRQETRSS